MSFPGQRACFVAAPLGTDLSVLNELLQARGIAIRNDSVGTDDSYTPQSLSAIFSKVELVCAVVPYGPVDPNLWVELGIAIGNGCAILLVIDPKVDLPWSLRSLQYARASIQDSKALSFHLDAFLSSQGIVARPPNPVSPKNDPKTRPIDEGVTETVRAALSSWRSFEGRVSEAEIVGVLTRLFFEKGWIATSSPNASYGRTSVRPDLSVWIDELPKYIGNPLLIEVKSRSKIGVDAISQFRLCLHEFQSGVGLFVYQGTLTESALVNLRRTSWPVVLAMTVSDLAESLINDTFIRKLIELRNLSAHSSSN